MAFEQHEDNFQNAMQGTGSRCSQLVRYTGLDSQKSTVVLGWAPGTRGQHGPRAVAGPGQGVGEPSGATARPARLPAPQRCWVEPDPGPPHTCDSRHAAHLPEVMCHCPS